MKSLRMLILLLAGIASLHTTQAHGGVTKEDYLAYAMAAADEAWAGLDAYHERWRENIDVQYVFGYTPP